MRPAPALTLTLTLACVAACATTPTGRNQLMLMGPEETAYMGEQSFTQLKQQEPIARDDALNRYVQCITEQLLAVADTQFEDWEVVVFESEQPNAFALPGGKIGVYTGMVQLTRTPDQLAAVIAHEIGHVQARHGGERVSQNLLLEGGLTAIDAAFADGEKGPLIMAALGTGAQVGVLLPFSRLHESEADEIGIELMARAGFDPRGAVELWQLMQQQGGAQPMEFLSTHPSHGTRIEDLQEQMDAALQLHQEARQAGRRPDCQEPPGYQ